MGHALSHAVYGDPLSVCELTGVDIPAPSQGQVGVRVLMAPVHPSDLNMMEGKYYQQPPLPVILGKEGVGEVVSVGEGVQHVKVGDRVISPFEAPKHWLGWWREGFVAHESDLMVVPDTLLVEQAAMVSLNPVTAWLLLNSIVSLPENGWIVQNAANSAVGVSVIQLAKCLGYRTLNIVRRDSLIAPLKEMGATEVFVYGDDVVNQARSVLDDPVTLGLNAVGGEQANDLARLMGQDGRFVTYGAMGRRPVTISNGLLIYKNVHFQGFIRARWCELASRDAVCDIVTILLRHMLSGDLLVPIAQVYPYTDYKAAIQSALTSGRNGKVLLSF